MLAKKLQSAASAVEPAFIEDVFSTYLYTGTGSSQSIVNNIDLSGEGGLVWIKTRSAISSHALYDTERGATFDLATDLTTAQTTQVNGLTAFNNNGFTIGTLAKLNTNASTYVSWAFRKQSKFFEIKKVSHTNGTPTIVDLSSLGTLGCVIFRDSGATSNWIVWHRSLGSSDRLVLNTTDSVTTSAAFSISGTTLTVTSAATTGTKLIYAFAHNAAGFGEIGSENAVSCGSYTGNGNATGTSVTLGYEPQFLLIKRTDDVSDWHLIDNIRGFVVGGTDSELNPNSGNAESTGTFVTPTATGFQLNTTDAGYNANGGNYVYIAIRRGLMREPTTGTSVLGITARSGTGANATVSGGNVADFAIIKNRGSAVAWLQTQRLTSTNYLVSNTTAAQVAAGVTILQASPWDVMNGVKVGTTSTITNASANTYINYLFSRAAGFFDVVCYTGTGANRTVSHNLGVVPELMIVKCRSAANDWAVYANNDNTDYLLLNSNAATADDATFWNDTSPTSSVFTVGTNADVNTNTATYVAYLFASVTGVSKVGTYTGTGTTNQINCGFTSGARFVMIKRLSGSTGDWYVYDTARGIIAGNDPFMLINTTAADVTNTDYIDAFSSGFELSSTAPAAINANGATFIFLAIA
jgi:hypothetical protein